jgi:hypothetical protein
MNEVITQFAVIAVSGARIKKKSEFFIVRHLGIKTIDAVRSVLIALTT